MKIAILTRPDFRSPRNLSESLKAQLKKAGVEADIFFSVDVLTRLYNYSESKSKIRFHFWLKRKLLYYVADKKIINKIKNYDAVIISECSPNGFWKDLYHVEKFRFLIKKPILFYEVYFLGNAPTQIARLSEARHPLMERYDWHLAVADVTEIKSTVKEHWSCIGLDLTHTTLKPTPKDEFIALIDFSQSGYERFREEQLNVLSELGIKIIKLTGSYTIEEIREIYKKSSVLFMQSSEAFGLPIAECLTCGVQIFTPSSAWPMSWRLDKDPAIHSEGILPDIFTTYTSTRDLKQKLISFIASYDCTTTPISIFERFITYYPHYYYGNIEEVKQVLNRIKLNRFH